MPKTAIYKVLIVEDDPMVAMINEQYVKRHKSFSLSGVVNDGKVLLSFWKKEVDKFAAV